MIIQSVCVSRLSKKRKKNFFSFWKRYDIFPEASTRKKNNMKEAIRERDPKAVLLVDFSARSEEAIRLLHPSERLIEKRRKKMRSNVCSFHLVTHKTIICSQSWAEISIYSLIAQISSAIHLTISLLTALPHACLPACGTVWFLCILLPLVCLLICLAMIFKEIFSRIFCNQTYECIKSFQNRSLMCQMVSLPTLNLEIVL
jgi:hypothetical protein